MVDEVAPGAKEGEEVNHRPEEKRENKGKLRDTGGSRQGTRDEESSGEILLPGAGRRTKAVQGKSTAQLTPGTTKRL